MKLKLLITTAFCCLTLAACEPMMFGMPQSQFKSLTPAQQNQVIQAYNQRQQTYAQNAPYENLINNIVPAISASKQQQSAVNNNPFPPPQAPPSPTMMPSPTPPSFPAPPRFNPMP
ncbi:MAG: hypothetical protein K0S08_174 [Gammaproteobacteria bacterium]|jgi:hypothetical protein|nr:hypothetical protein [Gammaproteobacteria bacterium]